MSQKYRPTRSGRRFILSIAAGAIASSCAVSRSPEEGAQAAAGSGATSGGFSGMSAGTVIQPPGTVIFPGVAGGGCSGPSCSMGVQIVPPGVMPRPPDAGSGPQVFPGSMPCPPELCPNDYDGGADD